MAEQEADFVTILSSELIATVMEQYFNKSMYKQRVKVVDLKPTETGYMFSLAFVKEHVEQRQQHTHHMVSAASLLDNGRDTKGRFTKVKGASNG